MASGAYDVVIGMHNALDPQASQVALGNYISGGGKLIYADWKKVPAIYSLFGASLTGVTNATLGKVTILDPLLATGVAAPLPVTNPGYGQWASGMSPTGAETLARFDNNDAAIVRKNSSNAILMGFLLDTVSATNGKALFKNMVRLLTSRAITSSAGPNGTISPSGSTYVTIGGSQTYTITPSTGYTIDTLTVDGTSVAAASTYTFTNVTAAHTISTTFRPEATDVSVTTSTSTTTVSRDVAFTPSYAGTAASYTWNFGDGTSTTSTTADPARHSFSDVGAFSVTCDVKDGSGATMATSTSTVKITSGVIEVAPDQPVEGNTIIKASETLTEKSADDLRSQFGITDATVRPLRAVSEFTATVSQPLALSMFRFKIYDMPTEVAKLRLFKLKPDGTNTTYTYGSSASYDKDGYWWITDEQGYDIPFTATLAPGTKYFVNFVIQDNGPFDNDLAGGVIKDPMSFSQSDNDAFASGSGGGGCIYMPYGGGGFELVAMLMGGAGLAVLRRRGR